MGALAKAREIWSGPWIPARYGKAPYFWMLSFVICGWKYLYVPPNALEISLLFISILVFFPIYVYSFWARGWQIVACIALVTSLGVVWAPHNFGGSSFIIFAATMSARFTQKKHAYVSLGCVLGAVVFISYLWQLPPFFWIPAALFSIPSTLSAIIGENLERTNAKLFRKQEEIGHLAALAERERIARDLHDLLGHTLSVITLKAELARKLFDRDNEACKQEIADIETTARHALAEVRSAVLGYRDTGLAHELRSAKNTLASAKVELISDVDPTPLPAVIENVIALALREAVTNIIRHSNATVCRLHLHVRGQYVHFHISDNGFVGVDNIAIIEKGNGLLGMSERVQGLQGEFQVTCKDGVTIDISLPLASEQDTN